jgi:hypothetical protein
MYMAKGSFFNLFTYPIYQSKLSIKFSDTEKCLVLLKTRLKTSELNSAFQILNER